MSRSIVILAGGLSHERDVSLRSGRRVAEALRAVGETVAVHDLDASLLVDLANDPPDCVIPLLHGASGDPVAPKWLPAGASQGLRHFFPHI